MGAHSSKSSDGHKTSSRVRNDKYESPQKARKSIETRSCKPSETIKPAINYETSITTFGSNNDDFYDGIPRYPNVLSEKSGPMRAKQGSEVGSRFGRAGTLGLEKAVGVLDTLGSSMINLNPNSGFASGVTIKGNELSILAFEVANTIVKGYALMESVSHKSIQHLKEVVLPSEGVKQLVSKETDELLKMVATDKREELKIFTGEVIRFGNHCKDPQWHNLDRYFEKHSKEPPKKLKEVANSVMQHLMTLVQYTAELYQELNTLDKLEQDDQNKTQVGNNNSNTIQRGETQKVELKSQRKKVKSLKKKSLWSKNMEEVMEKLVDIVLSVNQEIKNAFGSTYGNKEAYGALSQQRLGPSGLSLHYANIVQQIDSIVARSTPVPSSTREMLYQNLPPCIKSSLRSKLQSFHVKEELTVTEIKSEIEKTLHWLAPIATNTSKAHHGFGWVGEWASTRSEVNRKQNGAVEIIRIETLHHADKRKTEDCILELLLWLNHMSKQFKAVPKTNSMVSPVKSSKQLTSLKKDQPSTLEPANNLAPVQSLEDMLRNLSNRKRTLGLSKSQNFDSTKNGLKKHDRLSKSSGHFPASKVEDFLPAKKHKSSVPGNEFELGEGIAMDFMDRVDTQISCTVSS